MNTYAAIAIVWVKIFSGIWNPFQEAIMAALISRQGNCTEQICTRYEHVNCGFIQEKINILVNCKSALYLSLFVGETNILICGFIQEKIDILVNCLTFYLITIFYEMCSVLFCFSKFRQTAWPRRGWKVCAWAWPVIWIEGTLSLPRIIELSFLSWEQFLFFYLASSHACQ